MRKISGIVLIIFSLIIAFSCALSFGEDLIFANIILWIIGIPLYVWGQISRTSKTEFKHHGKRWVAIYIFFFFILPLLIYLHGYYNDLKENTFIDEQYIMYEPASGMLGDLSLGIFMLLVLLCAGRFLNPGLKRKGLLNAAIIGTIIILIGFNYLMFSDYRGIHKERGLVSSNWKGEKHIISYEDIESVYVKPYVHYASLSNTSDETRFVWKVIFQLSNSNNEVVYHFSMVTKSNLERTMDIKKIATENDLPFIVEEIDQKILKWFDLDLELEGLDKDCYYKLFQVKKK
ncbi:hypothetical protein [Lysinibacillus odysseyi]|uniref:Uncharacterized protein n=1 Tax=Lysinibacillus odysseyi 34hs-1 = NBRC 100172 TaxID=1220589 RepID=A0A0A3ITK0_9BACI|nr:hypothetical protein [Lysinibacillus odysseyi]KGR86198.1 hypothetical protein CD32_07340 [Lysinibacillus odysseyi 34hs-1 = NBRC 100172]